MITASLLADTAPAPDHRSRELTDSEHAAVLAVGAATGGLALIGFANSFAAVSRAAEPSFGGLAVTVPLGIDLGIAVFAALDIVLARLDMRPKWVRLIPWALTLATVYLNVAGQHSWFARIAHAVFPCLWVLAVEAGVHVIRVRAGLASGTAMDRIRRSRWLLAPLSSFGLWRRMVLWEIRSYPDALARERARVLARTELADAYGWRWRWTAPRRTRALYRLGQHPATATDTPAAIEPAATPDISPDSPAVMSRPARRTPARSGTATAVARLAARYPDMPTSAIARRLKVSDRTVRRHLAAARPLTSAPADADSQQAA
jgi:hypothetical protein